jgi:Uma2 family endonuclease
MSIARPRRADCGCAVKKWTRREYVRLFRLGLLGETKVELVGGLIETVSPQFDSHAAAITLTQRALEAAFGDGFWVRVQTTLNLGPGFMPDLDISVVAGSPKGADRTYATSALLVVEVSDTTLKRDRGRKLSLYAKHGLTDYWIVNLDARQLELYRDPQPDSSRRFGFGYAQSATFKPGDSVNPLAKPDAAVPVADLFP